MCPLNIIGEFSYELRFSVSFDKGKTWDHQRKCFKTKKDYKAHLVLIKQIYRTAQLRFRVEKHELLDNWK